MKIVIRIPASDRLKVVDFPTQAEAQSKLAEYLSNDNTLQFFRVIANGNDFTLRRLRIAPGTEVTETRLISATFEDDI